MEPLVAHMNKIRLVFASFTRERIIYQEELTRANDIKGKCEGKVFKV